MTSSDCSPIAWLVGQIRKIDFELYCYPDFDSGHIKGIILSHDSWYQEPKIYPNLILDVVWEKLDWYTPRLKKFWIAFECFLQLLTPDDHPNFPDSEFGQPKKIWSSWSIGEVGFCVFSHTSASPSLGSKPNHPQWFINNLLWPSQRNNFIGLTQPWTVEIRSLIFLLLCRLSRLQISSARTLQDFCKKYNWFPEL